MRSSAISVAGPAIAHAKSAVQSAVQTVRSQSDQPSDMRSSRPRLLSLHSTAAAKEIPDTRQSGPEPLRPNSHAEELLAEQQLHLSQSLHSSRRVSDDPALLTETPPLQRASSSETLPACSSEDRPRRASH